MQRNLWSDEGVSTNRDGNTVECEATHLTSFSVLVDVQGISTTTVGSVIHRSTSICIIDIYIVLDSVYCQLHWLWNINIFFASYNVCNCILEVHT